MLAAGSVGAMVHAAETAPEKDPQMAPWVGEVSLDCAKLHIFLRPSYIGNWMNEKGISRATVVQYPMKKVDTPASAKILDTASGKVLY